MVHLENPQSIVIPKRSTIARGICCFAVGNKQIPRRVKLAAEWQGVGLFFRKLHHYPFFTLLFPLN
jgi:hypothetical protein